MSNYFIKGIKDACGVPVIGLSVSMFAFGAYLRSSEFNLLQSFLSTFFAFALPGQFVMAETLISGGNLINIFIAVLLTNARLFPMTMYIIPTIKSKNKSNWRYFLICHFIAVTSWINYISKKKKIKQKNRYDYFLGLSGTLWFSSVVFTGVGYTFSSLVSYKFLLGLVFFNPMYFLLMSIRNIINLRLLTIFCLSAFMAPMMYLYFLDWGIISAGLISGTLGYLFFRNNKYE